jgi:DNA transposition AAA+ family ATPase
MPSLHHSHPEPAERSDKLALCWTPKFPDQFAACPAPWQPLITRIKEMQQVLNIADNSFAGPFLTGSAWNQLCNGAYRVPTTQRGIDTIQDNLAALLARSKEMLTQRAEPGSRKLTLAERFVDRPEYQEVLDGLEDAARNAEDELEERVVLIVGGTRCGKSTLVAKLIADNKVHWSMQASPIMKRSYKQFLLGIGDALKIRGLYEERTVKRGGEKEKITVEPSQARLQSSIISKLDKVRGVLAIQELQSFSPAALEFLKKLLNDTQVSLVICMLPGQYARLCRQTSEDMQQFLGRSVGVVQLKVTDKLVAKFAPKLWKSCPNAGELQRMIAHAADQGGGMSLVRDVCRDAALLAESEGVKTHHITNALLDYRRKVPAMERRAA